MIYARSGMKGHNVQTWQKAINGQRAKIGFDKISEDGVFGSKTLSATIATQKWLGVPADGVVGDGTKKAWEKKVPFMPLAFYNPKITSNEDKKLFESMYQDSLPIKSIFKTPFKAVTEDSPSSVPEKKPSVTPVTVTVISAITLFYLLK